MSSNSTQSNHSAANDDITKSFNDLFDFMINKALILCFTIICICVLVLIICIVIYKIIKTKKQNFAASVNASSTHLERNNNDVQTDSLREVSHSNAGKLGFNSIHNTSQSQHDNISIGNKDSMSLSELRIQNEKFATNNVINSSGSKNSNSTQSSNDSNDIEVKVKKTKGKKKRKSNNANSNRSNTESSKGEDVSTPKEEVDIANELQKQIDM